ncbi:TIR domain-containing protein [uncultured Mucilaginibacter sp.]|uniref:TIR domain-containing protein n=1 Tax=uncultured Mucilaginibacter sp. TaxID=797541 RepID=UPI0025FC669E|nr:TIR domain-containing protein [uncultured Mucilaginibacter sp.]
MTYLEDVFKTSGIPTYTFVKPSEYNKLIVSLRTQGRCLVIEGPSGIGKTTSITKAIEELGLNRNVYKLSARKKEDRDMIQILPEFKDIGTVIIDDFHTLDDEYKLALSDYMKTLADEERETSKLILIGINKAGDSLVKFASDLNNRIDTIKFEINTDERVEELIEKGEDALGIKINTKKEIIELSRGSFHITQMLCKETCIYDNVLENEDTLKNVTVSIEIIKEKVLEEFSRTFYSKARDFSVGSKLRREGRAPYLHLLFWLSQSNDWTIQMDDVMSAHPALKLSVNQIVEKGYLEKLIAENKNLNDVIHYDSNSKILSIEDPKFYFYIRNILWNKFASQIGFISIKFDKNYDFALSFAGENRELAAYISDLLLEKQLAVFYDKNEQYRILAENVEDYLAPIYNSEAQYVVVLLSNDYPKKIWTKFESDNFKKRFGDNSIIPIWYSNATPGLFDETTKYGGITFNVDDDLESQAIQIVDNLILKITEERVKIKQEEEELAIIEQKLESE